MTDRRRSRLRGDSRQPSPPELMNSHNTEELVAAKRQRRAGCCQGCRCAQKSLNPVRGQILTEGLHREDGLWWTIMRQLSMLCDP
ncbi:hypothetical protein ATANTOWER_028217 [Ataeniobius toweri]|uniref:Uncharacterized protein n=1 Tax=Ataeniobius toweri TaxID=208326 RepID=A0ABU7CF50_9TELE|nr:hypothetical protein [Ataeniobius toweri]